jgi:hypothetical protein
MTRNPAGLDPACMAAKRTIMSNKFLPILRLLARPLIICLVLAGSHPLISRQAFAGTRFDGTWNLVFVTQRGDCDPTYSFTLDVVNGNITHPNILTFRGRVAPSGAVVASVRVRTEVRVGIWKAVRSVGARRLELPFGRYMMYRYVGRAEKLTTRAMRHVEFEHA